MNPQARALLQALRALRQVKRDNAWLAAHRAEFQAQYAKRIKKNA